MSSKGIVRAPTGMEGLDSVINGGFPRGSLILVAGNPGTGKTVFCSQWIYKGCTDYDERGIYASFAESRETFFDNMRSFGFNFEDLEKEGRFSFLDLVTVKEEGISRVMERILNEVFSLKATRLVIDSFSALAQAFKEPIDTRSVLHTILSKMIRRVGCTTMLVVEVPYGENKIGHGIEEFIADAVLHFSRRELDDVIIRELTLLKIRGTEVTYPKLAFTLKGGFQVFSPITIRGVEQLLRKYKIIPHHEDYFSIGIRDLDEVLGRMFRRGCYDLLEIEKDIAFPIQHLISPTICNFLNQGYGVVVLPPQGISPPTIKKSLKPYVGRQMFQDNLRIMEYRGKTDKPYIIPLEGRSLEEDMEVVWNIISDLREKTHKPVLSIMGFDTVEYTYGEREALKILGEDIARTRNLEDLRINIIRPTIHIADQLRALADIYLKVEQIHGALFLRGIKPKTPLMNVKISITNEFSEVKLTPIL